MFIRNSLKVWRENKLDLLIIATTILWFAVKGILGQHWDYVAPAVWALCLILIHHFFNATREVHKEIEQETRESETNYESPILAPSGGHAYVTHPIKRIPFYWPRLYGMFVLFSVLCLIPCVLVTRKSNASDRKEFLLKYHDPLLSGETGAMGVQVLSSQRDSCVLD